MHILIFGDQHTESLGGAQTSIRLQKRFLEQAGHTVTICQPALHRQHKKDSSYLDLPSLPITWDREYGITLPSKKVDARLDAWLTARKPVDVVHVQADYAYAWIGHRFAARHNLPVVHTVHTNVDASLRQTVGALYGAASRTLFFLQRKFVGPRQTHIKHPVWGFIDEYAQRSKTLIAPSGHFARQLQSHGVKGAVRVVRTGVDDTVASEAFTFHKTAHSRPLIVWTGRMSPEKRLLPFLEAVYLSGVEADIEVYGTGVQLARAKKYVKAHRGQGKVHVLFKGRVQYRTMLKAIARADILVQTSIGFETQGMTVFEAVTLDTHVVVSDSNIAKELPESMVTEPHGKSVGALADALVEATQRCRTKKPRSSMRRDYLQSTIEAELIELYESITKKR